MNRTSSTASAFKIVMLSVLTGLVALVSGCNMGGFMAGVGSMMGWGGSMMGWR